MIDNIQQYIEEAVEAVSKTPEEYKKIAFEVILKHFLSISAKPIVKGSAPQKSKTSHLDVNAILNSDFDWSSTNIPNLKPIIQNLYILKIAKDLGTDALTPQDIQTILYHKFRVSKTHNAVSMSLMQATGKYIDRIQEGRKFLYKIADRGLLYLQSEIQKVSEKE